MCIRDRGTLSETGELTWSTDSLDIETEQGDAPLRDLFIHGGFLGDGSEIGGAEGGGTLHTAVLSQYLFAPDTGLASEDEMCELIGSFGLECYDCLGDGDRCIDLRFHAGIMTLDTGDFPDDPTDCGVDLKDGQVGPVEIECELPDFSCAASFFGLLGLTGWLRRRGDRSDD